MFRLRADLTEAQREFVVPDDLMEFFEPAECGQCYLCTMVAVFREVRRVLRRDGTCWVNMGDSYSGGKQGRADHGSGDPTSRLGSKQDGIPGGSTMPTAQRPVPPGYKPKDLLMMPARLALALQGDGWWVRSDIIWHKPNPMPESCRDRPTSAHEHVFLLTKSARYFYDADAVREDSEPSSLVRAGIVRKPSAKELAYPCSNSPGERGNEYGTGRNLRNVWTIATHAFSESHFATMPTAVVEKCVLAGTSERGACAACGKPWGRVTERGNPDLAHQRASGGDANGEYHGSSTKNHAAAGVQDASAVKARILAGMLETTTTGWSPTCQCSAANHPMHRPRSLHRRRHNGLWWRTGCSAMRSASS